MKCVQCYELFGGIAIKNHAFFSLVIEINFYFFLSIIDYCSSLLFGSTHDVTSHLQLMQNYAVRVILCFPKSAHILNHFIGFLSKNHKQNSLFFSLMSQQDAITCHKYVAE